MDRSFASRSQAVLHVAEMRAILVGAWHGNAGIQSGTPELLERCEAVQSCEDILCPGRVVKRYVKAMDGYWWCVVSISGKIFLAKLQGNPQKTNRVERWTGSRVGGAFDRRLREEFPERA